MKFMLCQTLCFAVVVPVLGAHTLTPNQQRRCWKAGWRSTQAFDSRLTHDLGVENRAYSADSLGELVVDHDILVLVDRPQLFQRGM